MAAAKYDIYAEQGTTFKLHLQYDSFVSLTLKLGGFLISSPTSVPKEHSINAVPALHCYVSDPFGNLIHLAQDI